MSLEVERASLGYVRVFKPATKCINGHRSLVSSAMHHIVPLFEEAVQKSQNITPIMKAFNPFIARTLF